MDITLYKLLCKNTEYLGTIVYAGAFKSMTKLEEVWGWDVLPSVVLRGAASPSVLTLKETASLKIQGVEKKTIFLCEIKESEILNENFYLKVPLVVCSEFLVSEIKLAHSSTHRSILVSFFTNNCIISHLIRRKLNCTTSWNERKCLCAGLKWCCPQAHTTMQGQGHKWWGYHQLVYKCYGVHNKRSVQRHITSERDVMGIHNKW